MNSLVLNRVSFLPTDNANSDQQELARRLSTEVEYDGYKDKLNAAEIARKLHAIGCPPFSASSVRRYKRWMELKAAGLMSVMRLSGFTLLAMGGLIAYWMKTTSSPAIAVPAGLVVLICIITSVIRFETFCETSVSWRSTTIAGYNKLIPDSAAQTMLRIKENFPNVGFNVEELRVHERVKDPFLIAVIDGYVFRVAVWDEAEYTPRIHRL